ncbi:class GN sortase [Pseudomarimonas arenosa]|uniref:Class GN sortase n=1 Tax=Pseudomarimonas arenosa TaxID=2774145 RepID=A0AAW3ZL24_9GAMM|nr:class GN sortase [Pseudomarimonas arenosa]MBD8525131.1 class GN sortase [Pseudomarimonas arenosa]
MKRSVLAAGALLLTALGLAAQASWLHAKAWLAQEMLEQAWQDSLAQGGSQRPWPWADTHPVAKLHVPGLGIEQIVLAGDSGRVMAFGPGWAPASAEPSDRLGSKVISGHRDTHFAWLAELTSGDLIELESLDQGRPQRRLYWISDLRVADSRVERLTIDDAQDRLVLVTCWPFNAMTSGGPMRYVVTAIPLERSEPADQTARTRATSARMREITSA